MLSENEGSPEIVITYTPSGTDTTPPSVSLTSPTSGATVSGTAVALAANASDNVAVANVQFEVDGSNIGTAATTSPYTATWNSTGVSNGSHTLSAVAVDTSGNYATSSITVTVSNPPALSAIAAGSLASTTATITWTTNENATSQVVYGLTTSYGTASTSAPLVTSHTITLSGLASSTTYHYEVVSTDGQGNTATSSDQTFTTAAACPRGTSYADGCPGAPAGSPQLPSLLTGYSTRPPWNVAGVDYAVGVPTGTTLQDPSTAALPTGCAYSSGTVTCSGNNVTIQGYDFSLHGGMNLVVSGSGDVITKNNFGETACVDPNIRLNSVGSTTITYNTIDGGGATCSNPVFGALIWGTYINGAVITREWNWIKNAPEDISDNGGPSSGSATIIDKYNFYDTQGWLGHPDGIQLNGGNFSDSLFSFNTYRNQNEGQAAAGGTQSIHIEAQITSTINNYMVDNDTVITPGTGGGQTANFDIACKNDGGWVDSNNGFSAFANYIDSTGAYGPTINSYNCTNTSWGIPAPNYNLVTGAQLPISSTIPPSVALTAPASGATVSGTAVALAATASDGVGVTGVQFEVDGTDIGAAATTSPYAATWNSNGVSNGTHTLSAVAEDTSGNYATSSVTVTVSNPPIISAISSGTPGSAAATVTWTTNENATSQVVYGLTTSYGTASTSASLLTSHTISLTGLSPSTTYHYAVVSTDGQGNTATSSDHTFTTAAAPLDTTPPSVSLTSPTSGATVAGTAVALAANASDNVAVANVPRLFNALGEPG